MDRKKVRKIGEICISVTLIIIVLTGIFYWLFIDIERIPKGELVAEYTSPSETYTVKFYVHTSSLSAPSVKGVLYKNQNERIKAIYNEYPQDQVDVIWLDDVSIRINDHEFNVLEDIYDWRHQ